jgi:hypothetical protein
MNRRPFSPRKRGLLAILSRAILVLSCALVCLVSTPAYAQGGDAARAAELKKRGDDAMDALKYTEALQHYGDAYAVNKDPAILYNMGRAYEALGQYPEAQDKLEQFQKDAPPELRAKVPGLVQRIADVQAHVSVLKITSNVLGARVVVAKKEVGTTPLAGPLRTNAGRATVEVIAEGFLPFRRDLDLKGGQQTKVDAQLQSKDTSAVIVIDSPVVGAEVDVDGKAAGMVPLEIAVPAGEHPLVVSKAGYETVNTQVVVKVGERRAVSIPLEASKPITARWWFWTGIGVVVVAGVVTTAALLTERSPDTGTYPPGRVSGPLVSGPHGAGLRW